MTSSPASVTVFPSTLTFQPFAKEQSKTVSQVLAEQGLKAAAFMRWVIGRR